jgi:hypothetical protein
MKYTIAGIAMLCASQAHAFDTGVPIADPYSGPRCFKFWLSGNPDQYAINPDSTWQINLIDEIRAAIHTNVTLAALGKPQKTITIGFQSDILPPLAFAYPTMAACSSGDGKSLKFYETPITVGVNP